MNQPSVSLVERVEHALEDIKRHDGYNAVVSAAMGFAADVVGDILDPAGTSLVANAVTAVREWASSDRTRSDKLEAERWALRLLGTPSAMMFPLLNVNDPKRAARSAARWASKIGREEVAVYHLERLRGPPHRLARSRRSFAFRQSGRTRPRRS